MRSDYRVRWLGVVTACLLVLTMAATGTASAAGKKSCNISGKQTSLGASYVTSLSVKGVGCRKGIRVVKAFHECRKANGGSDGRCKRKVKKFKCSESRDGVPNVQYNSSVKCKKGTKRVWHTYTQNV